MPITTTATLQGHDIKGYFGLASGEAILGSNASRLLRHICDIVGGRSAAYQWSPAIEREPMSSELAAAIMGGLIGGVLGVVGTLVSSYYGPRKIEEWRERRIEERTNGPRKRLLRSLLEDERFEDGRTIDTLARVTGTTAEIAECC